MNDKEIQSLLNKILENQSSMKSEMDFIKSEITSMKTDITSMKSEMTSIKNKLERNTLMLEKVHDDFSQDVVLVEAVSGKNMKDIAHLKLIK